MNYRRNSQKICILNKISDKIIIKKRIKEKTLNKLNSGKILTNHNL